MIVSANTVTIVIAISAIISPILVAIINNHHQAKMKKLEFKHQENLKNLEIKETHEKKVIDYIHSIYESYLKSASRYISNPTNDNKKTYGENYSISFVYFPPKAHDRLKEINSLIRSHDYVGANGKLEELSIWMSALMKDMLKW